MGSVAYEEDLKRLGTRHANISVRRALGLGSAARLESLFAVAGLTSARNLYLRSCAAMLDRALRAKNSVLQARMDSRLRRVYDVGSWEVKPTRLSLSATPGPRELGGEDSQITVGETWLCDLLETEPELDEGFTAPSIFFTNAPEINEKRSLKEVTYNFRNGESWYGVGLQILAASGWRPDCVQSDSLNAARMLPPRLTGKRNWIAVVSAEAMLWDHAIHEKVPRPTGEINGARPLETEVVTFYVQGYATSCSYTRAPSGVTSCQGWVIGRDGTRLAPIRVKKFALFHGCILTLQLIRQSDEKKAPRPTVAYLRAGDPTTCTRLLDWLNGGVQRFASSAGPKIVAVIQCLAEELQCPLIIQSTERERYTAGGEWGQDGAPSSYIIRTQTRLWLGCLRTADSSVLSRTPRIPLSKDEVKERLGYRYEKDERLRFRPLANCGSISCTLFIEWNLSRAIIKGALQELFYKRRLQVTLASVLAGTRFKYYDTLMGGGGSVRLPTVCRMCGRKDSPEHLISHMSGGAEGVPNVPEEIIEFLTKLAITANAINPQISTPYAMEVAEEIELSGGESGRSESQSEDTLSFDIDENL